MLSIGQVVYSKNGRDKGFPFFIIGIEGEYVLLSDGKRRTLSKPKRKKLKHVQLVNEVDEKIRKCIEEGLYIKDSDLRSALAKLTGSLK